MHHGFARCKNALAVGVSGRIGQIADHVLLDFFWCIKAEGGQIANIELDDLLPLLLHLARCLHDGAADVVQDIVQFGGFVDAFHTCSKGKDQKI